MYGETPEHGAGETWAKGLRGMSHSQLRDGIEACVNRAESWPPTLPEFKTLCFSIPAFAQVRAEIVDPASERSRFTRLVWQKLDAYRWRQMSADQADKFLREAYNLAVDHVLAGGEMPQTPVANLTAPQYEHHKRTEAVARDALARIAQSLGVTLRSGHHAVPDAGVPCVNDGTSSGVSPHVTGRPPMPVRDLL